MSTILKALKRLETEQEPQNGGGGLSAGDFNVRKTLHRQSAFSLLRNRMVLWLFIALLFIIGILTVSGLLLSHPKKERETILAPLEKRGKHRPSTAANVRGPSSNSAPDAKFESREPLLAKPGSPSSRPTGGQPAGSAHRASHIERSKMRQTTASRADEPKMAGPPARVTAVAGGGTPDAPATSQLQSTAAKTNTNPKKPPRTTEREDDPYEGAQRLNDGRLKVQAIAWAPEPTERMAVVNNRIVREGGNLEGFFIVGIGRDAVFVREEGRLLKVPFGKP